MNDDNASDITNPGATDPGDFDSTGVDEFGDPGEFTGTMPGEQAPAEGEGEGGDGPDLDKILAGVDMTDAAADLAAGKPVPFNGHITRIGVWCPEDQPGRIVVKLGITPQTPPAAAKLGEQTVWCDIAAWPGDPEQARAIASDVCTGSLTSITSLVMSDSRRE